MRTQLSRTFTILSSLAFLATLTTPAAAQQSLVRPNLKYMGASFASEGVAAAPAPRAHHAGFGFGVEAGITRSTVHFENASDFVNSRTGTMFGIWFGGNREGLVGVMGEVAYVIKGFNQEGSSIKLYYLEVPILIRLNIGSHSTNGPAFYVIAGPVFDVKLKAKIDDLDLGDSINNVDVGVIAGAGFEVVRIGIEGRGNWGLRTIDKTGIDKIKNFSFCVLVKIRIM